MYYVYRHIRIDSGMPFYIGIGTVNDRGNTFEKQYHRAYRSSNRNNYWMHIYEKIGREVEILFEHESRDVIHQKEQEFISLYGRISNGGILCNMTDGGDGFRNLDKDIIKKIADFNRGSKRTPEQIERISRRNKINGQKMHLKYKKGEIISPCLGKHLSEDHKKKISNGVRKRFGYKEKKPKCKIGSPEFIEIRRKIAAELIGRKIMCIDTGMVFNCAREANRIMFSNSNNAISNAMRVGNCRYKGYTFKYI